MAGTELVLLQSVFNDRCFNRIPLIDYGSQCPKTGSENTTDSSTEGKDP